MTSCVAHNVKHVNSSIKSYANELRKTLEIFKASINKGIISETALM